MRSLVLGFAVVASLAGPALAGGQQSAPIMKGVYSAPLVNLMRDIRAHGWDGTPQAYAAAWERAGLPRRIMQLLDQGDALERACEAGKQYACDFLASAWESGFFHND